MLDCLEFWNKRELFIFVLLGARVRAGLDLRSAPKTTVTPEMNQPDLYQTVQVPCRQGLWLSYPVPHPTARHVCPRQGKMKEHLRFHWKLSCDSKTPGGELSVIWYDQSRPHLWACLFVLKMGISSCVHVRNPKTNVTQEWVPQGCVLCRVQHQCGSLQPRHGGLRSFPEGRALALTPTPHPGLCSLECAVSQPPLQPILPSSEPPRPYSVLDRQHLAYPLLLGFLPLLFLLDVSPPPSFSPLIQQGGVDSGDLFPRGIIPSLLLCHPHVHSPAFLDVRVFLKPAFIFQLSGRQG